MENKVCTENICINETIFDGVAEQSLELDYMLPDYCSNIFKVLKCSVCPRITAHNLSGSRLTIDGVAIFHVLYLSEDNGRIRQLEQKQAFTKTVELREECDNGSASLHAKCDYVNCRAVNSRRLDLRGAVSIKVCVIKPKDSKIVSDCSELQILKATKTVCDKRITSYKEFTVREELQIGQGNKPIHDILRYEAIPTVTEQKLLANKVVFKGEVLLHTLYSCNDDTNPQQLEHSVAISQIVDFDGVDEDFACITSLEVVKYDIDMQIEDDGECHSFAVQISIRANCEAAKNKELEFALDSYSTKYEMEKTVLKLKLETMNRVVDETVMFKSTIQISQSELSHVYDIMYDVDNVLWAKSDRKLSLSCNLQLSVLALDAENNPICVEQSVLCEVKIGELIPEGEFSFSPTVKIMSLAYVLASGGQIEIRAQIKVCGLLFLVGYESAISAVEVHEDKIKQCDNDCALRLYFADDGENVWEIAKRYNTSVTAILEQNSIESESITSRGMILIPII